MSSGNKTCVAASAGVSTSMDTSFGRCVEISAWPPHWMSACTTGCWRHCCSSDATDLSGIDETIPTQSSPQTRITLVRTVRPGQARACQHLPALSACLLYVKRKCQSVNVNAAMKYQRATIEQVLQAVLTAARTPAAAMPAPPAAPGAPCGRSPAPLPPLPCRALSAPQPSCDCRWRLVSPTQALLQ